MTLSASVSRHEFSHCVALGDYRCVAFGASVPRSADNAEYGISHYLGVLTCYLVIRVVGSVHFSGDVVSGSDVLKSYDCSGAVRNEGISVIDRGACAHPRKDRKRCKLEGTLIETYTVCGDTHLETFLTQRILKAELEERERFVIVYISGEVVVVLKFIVCVLGAVCLDNVLDTVHLSFGLTVLGSNT